MCNMRMLLHAASSQVILELLDLAQGTENCTKRQAKQYPRQQTQRLYKKKFQHIHGTLAPACSSNILATAVAPGKF